MQPLTSLLALALCSRTVSNSAAFNYTISCVTLSLLNHTLITSVVYTIYGKSHDNHGLQWRNWDSIIVRRACKHNRRLLSTFQTSLKYALTFPCGEFCTVFWCKLSRHLALWYLELHSNQYLFRVAVSNFLHMEKLDILPAHEKCCL